MAADNHKSIRGPRKDITGRRFGRWIVLSFMGNSFWLCRCDCGNETTVNSYKLTSGYKKSCGCYFKDAVTTHGRSRTRTYKIWMHMRQRCENSAGDSYANYGGRGISVCARWASFENFLSDMGDAPTDLSLERIDVNGNYEPANCRWATDREQAGNTRRNKVVTIDGVEMLLTDAIEMLRRTARYKNV